MGKGRKKEPFTLRFEPPGAGRTAATTSTGGSARNPLWSLFPELDATLLDEILAGAGADEEVATARVIEMFQAEAQQRDGPAGMAPSPRTSPPDGHAAAAASAASGQQQAARPSGEGVKKESVFEMLPDDLLLKLLGSAFFRAIDLVVAAHVCRKWRRIIADIMASISSADLCHRSDKVNLALLKACQNAKTVRIRGPFRAFLHVQRNAPCLGAGGHAVTLTHMKLVKCENLSDEMVTGMLTSMPALSSLEIDSCDMVTDGAFNDLWEHRMLIDMGEITGELMARLQQLDITNCPLVTGQAVKYAIMALCGGKGSSSTEGGRCLQGLKFGGNGPLGQEPILLAARRLKRVHIKDASSFTNLALVACESLQDFTLHNSLQVRNIAIEAPHLEALALTSCKMLLRVKVESHRELTSLNLHGCRALDHLECPSPLLSALNMYGCLAAGDMLVQAVLSQADRSLREVTLDGLVRVASIRLRAPVLEKLVVKGCKGLALLRLEAASSLASLDTRGCELLGHVCVDACCPWRRVKVLGKVPFKVE